MKQQIGLISGKMTRNDLITKIQKNLLTCRKIDEEMDALIDETFVRYCKLNM
jgi:hypothetical protein